jgi:hypothetical protein
MKTSSLLSLLTLAAILAGTVASTRAADNGPVGTPSAADLAALKALNLDPKDPNLRAKLQAISQKRQADLQAKVSSQSTTPTVTPLTTSPRSITLSTALGPGAGPLVKNTAPHNDAPKIARMATAEGSLLTSSTEDRFGHFNLAAGDTFYLSGTNLVGSSGAPKVTGDYGNCGKISMPTTYVGSFTPVGSKEALDVLQVTVPPLTVDEIAKDGDLTLTTSGGYDTIKHVRYAAALESVRGSVNVWDTAQGPLNSHVTSSTPFLGMIEGQTMDTSSGGTRSSGYPGWLGGQGGSGTDEFGESIKLEHGWTASASIVPYSEGMSVAINGPTHFTTSLQLFVNWSYPANQGISYTLYYTLTGPVGGVPLSNMPQQNDCAAVKFT